MDDCYYYAWSPHPPFFVFSRRDFSHQSLTKEALQPPTWSMINHKLFTSLPPNPGANFTESVFVIDNYSGRAAD